MVASENPSGVLGDWNQRVRCRFFRALHDASSMGFRMSSKFCWPARPASGGGEGSIRMVVMDRRQMRGSRCIRSEDGQGSPKHEIGVRAQSRSPGHVVGILPTVGSRGRRCCQPQERHTNKSSQDALNNRSGRFEIGGRTTQTNTFIR